MPNDEHDILLIFEQRFGGECISTAMWVTALIIPKNTDFFLTLCLHLKIVKYPQHFSLLKNVTIYKSMSLRRQNHILSLRKTRLTCRKGNSVLIESQFIYRKHNQVTARSHDNGIIEIYTKMADIKFPQHLLQYSWTYILNSFVNHIFRDWHLFFNYLPTQLAEYQQ